MAEKVDSKPNEINLTVKAQVNKLNSNIIITYSYRMEILSALN
jgi:hypothetical protein